MLQPRDHAPFDVPAVGRVDELVDKSLLEATGLVLFPFALLGLRSTLGRRGGRAGRVGGVVALIAAVSGVLTLLVRAGGGEGVVPAEDDVTLMAPVVRVTGADGIVNYRTAPNAVPEALDTIEQK